MNYTQNKDKEGTKYQLKHFKIGCNSMKNWRVAKEENRTYVVSIKEDPKAGFFGLYDGYGGDSIAQYATKHLHKLIVQNEEYMKNNIEKALKKGFLDMDSVMQRRECGAGEPSVGSSALVVLIKEHLLYCATVGNCQAIASVRGQLVHLSVEHKPTDDKPHISRSLGDYQLKRVNARPTEYIYTAYPDLETFCMTDEWEFIVLCCNGIWNAMPPTELLQFCRQRIARGMEPADICKELTFHCYTSHPDRKDYRWAGNLTVILVCLLQDKPYSELQSRCAKTITNDKPIESFSLINRHILD